MKSESIKVRELEGMQKQLKVIKTNGSVEEYLHTKVIGTISSALAEVGQADVYVAEELAEAVTYFLYHEQHRRSVSSSEIFSIIKAALMATRYENAAIALDEYHLKRRLKRCRIEVVSVDIEEMADVGLLCKGKELGDVSRWDKSRIATGLVTRHNLCRHTARMIAGMVEQKIFDMGLTFVPTSLIKQLVLNDTATVLAAHRQLQTV